MVNNIKKIIGITLIMIQFVSCQEQKNLCSENGFCVQDTLLYYNQKPLTMGSPIENFVDAMGKYDRKIIDSIGGEIYREWYWNTQKYEAYTFEGKITFKLKENEYKEYTSIDEITEKYGKYDSIKVEKTPVRTSAFYIWDQLGVSINADKEGKRVGNVFLQTLHYSKYMNPKSKRIVEGLLHREETEKDRAEMKEYLKTVSEYPKNEYKGKFTYNGNTIDFNKLDNENWIKVVNGLKISGERYNPPGDSDDWSREIRATYDLYVIFNRADSKRDHMKDKYNAVQNIAISWNKTDDEKK